MRKKGLIDIYILEILKKHSAVNNKLTQKQISYYLDRDYNLEVSRNTLSGYLDELRDDGYIVGQRGVYCVNEFDDHELRLLIDGVLFGKHIPKTAANNLIDKLKKQSAYSMKNRIKHVCYLEGINRTDNEKLYEIIDKVDEAIEHNFKIEITQCFYQADGKLHDGGNVILDPYYLVTEKCRYYLICNMGRNDLDIRRIDRISQVKILREKRTPIESIPGYSNGFDLAMFLKEHIYMTYGESIHIRIRILKKRIGEFIDWFGTGYNIADDDGEYLTISVKANANAVYYWVLQYGEIAEVVAPKHFRERVRTGLENMLEKYKNNFWREYEISCTRNR